jgi:hypothetical protein
MDEELDLGKYSAAFRRARRPIVAVVLVGSLLGLFVGVRAPSVWSGTLTWVDRAAELDAAGVDPANVDVRQAVVQVVSVLDGEGFEATLDDGASVGASAVLTETGGTVAVEIEAGSPGAVERTADRVVELAGETYVGEVRTQVDGIAANFQRRTETLNQQLQSIDEQILAAGVEQTTLTEGLLAQAQVIRTDLAEAVDQLAALDAYIAVLDQDIRFRTAGVPERARPAALMVVLGAVLGGLVAAGIVAAVTALDRRIRTRRDLERLGLVNLVGVVSRGLETSEIAVASAAVKLAANRAACDSVQLVPVGEGGRTGIAQQLVDRLDPMEVAARQPIEVDASATVDAAPTSLNVLLVRWGRDDRVSTMSAANRLAAVSGTPIAVLLVDVPKREIAWIER